MDKLTYSEIIDRITLMHPDLKVLEFCNHKNRKKVIVQDELGIKYLVQIYHLLAGKKPSILTAIDKTLALKIKVKNILPNIKILGEYTDNRSPILVEDKLNIQYYTRPGNLLFGRIPTIKSAVNKNEAFIIKAKQIHDNKFDYSKVEYKSFSTKIKIKCLKHGYFMQTPNSHLNGKGCRKCANKELKFTRAENGWDKSHWVKYCNRNPNNDPKLYIIHCFDNKEQFIKIGITSKKITERYLPKDIPYNYQVIKIIDGYPGTIYDLEKKLKGEYKGFRYIPRLKFKGYTECFSELIMEPILKEVA
jgi:hypothetical protein